MRHPFGTTPDGEAVERVTLRSSAGIEVSVISYGAAIQELWAPDRDGRRANIVLGFADLDGYTSGPSHYFGAIIGRFANRIGGGRFTLDGLGLRAPTKRRRELASRRATRLRQAGVVDRGGVGTPCRLPPCQR